MIGRRFSQTHSVDLRSPKSYMKTPTFGPALILYVKEEVHYIAVLNDVFLAFDTHFTGGADGCL